MKTIFTRLFTFDSIRKKILFSLVLIVVIPIMTITALFYSSIVNTMKESLSKSIMNSLDIANNSMDKLLSNMMVASNLLTFDNEILDILDKGSKRGQYTYDDIAKLDSKIFNLEMVSLIPNALRVSMTSFNGNYYTNWYGSDVDYYKKYSDENWYERIKQLDGYILWLAPQPNYISEAEKDRSFISLARVLKKERKGVGMLLVSIYEDKFFNSIFMTEKLFNSSNTFVLNNETGVLSASDKSLIGKDLSNHNYIQSVLSSSRGSVKARQDGEEILVGFVTNERTGWKIVNTVTYRDLFDKMDSNIRQNIILIAVFLLIFIMAALTIGFIITRPIQRIRQLMQQIDAGRLDETVEIKSNDEIGQLGRSFNAMLEQIKDLIEKVREEQDNKQQLKFEALQAQINPHFLFNTLNTIKWNALINQDKSTADMLKSLGTILEESMQKASDYTTLSKELEVLKSYLFIQKVRYNQRFKVNFSVEDDILQYRTLRFLLQPVVENALIHGMNEKFSEIHISISARKCSEKLLITVEDDGAGIEAERLKSLTEWGNNSNEKKRYSGIGIRNVHERIILHYGEGYGLTISSEEGRGTTVQISIPIQKGEFSNENTDH